MSNALRFTKMHGIGNDFVIIDCRSGQAAPESEKVQAMADRHFGVGFDQLLTIHPAHSSTAIASYDIHNADGSKALQCGNGARCVAAYLQRDGSADKNSCKLDGPAGSITVRLVKGEYAIAMGVPDFHVNSIGLNLQQATQYCVEYRRKLIHFAAVSMGNPHALISVTDVAMADVQSLGTILQKGRWFKNSVNVGFAQIVDKNNVRLRVFERGAGETLACGSGACAAAAILIRRNLVNRNVAVHLPGGTLHIHWPDADSSITMSGPASFVFEGEWLV